MGGLLRRWRGSPLTHTFRRLFAKLSGLPRLLLLVGQDELLLDDALRVRDAGTAAGTDVRVHVGKGMQHDWPLSCLARRKPVSRWSGMRSSSMDGVQVGDWTTAVHRKGRVVKDEMKGLKPWRCLRLLTRFGASTTRGASLFRTPGISAAPGCWRSWVFLRWPRPARDSPGRSAVATMLSPSRRPSGTAGRCRSVAMPISADSNAASRSNRGRGAANVRRSRQDRYRRPLDRRLHRRSRPNRCSIPAGSRADPARPGAPSTSSGTGISAHRTFRRLHRRPSRSRGDHSPPDGIRRGGCRLPLRSGPPQPRREVAAVVVAVAPKPVNVLVGIRLHDGGGVAPTGVRRISVGGALARAAWTGFLQAAPEIAEQGTFTGWARAIPFAAMNRSFPE